jgi:hypothetical protein
MNLFHAFLTFKVSALTSAWEGQEPPSLLFGAILVETEKYFGPTVLQILRDYN